MQGSGVMSQEINVIKQGNESKIKELPQISISQRKNSMKNAASQSSNRKWRDGMTLKKKAILVYINYKITLNLYFTTFKQKSN